MSGGIGGFARDFVRDHGLGAVFFLMAVESCGIPFPSEVIMPVAGAVAAGAIVGAHLGLVPAIVAGAAGNLLGSLVAWALAARFGEPLLLGPGRYIGISKSHIELADRFFARRGLLAVFVGRVLPVIRTYISFPAGLARVPIVPFAVLTFLGALPWSAGLAIAGYEVGANYDRISGPIEKAAVVIAVLVVIAVVMWFVRGRGRRQPV
ncbi:MAG TPA: DedA family protein [Candidatus Dormibacteraeota bacterium]|nr:DedA family protein [Candidatus Dormibacteraeota bacterium]